MQQPRPYTDDEVEKLFLKLCWQIIEFWITESRTISTRGKVRGAVFSILAMIDGSNTEIPGFKLICNPHHHRRNGQNWFPEVDIAGRLHEHFYQEGPNEK